MPRDMVIILLAIYFFNSSHRPAHFTSTSFTKLIWISKANVIVCNLSPHLILLLFRYFSNIVPFPSIAYFLPLHLHKGFFWIVRVLSSFPLPWYETNLGRPFVARKTPYLATVRSIRNWIGFNLRSNLGRLRRQCKMQNAKPNSL